MLPFTAISGANTYGADLNDEALVVGTDNTPVNGGYVKFDLHRILVVSLSTDTTWKFRVVWGTGTMGDAVSNSQFSELMVQNNPAGSKAGGFPVEVMMPRANCGTDKIWIQAWNATNNATATFLVGWHEYLG